MTTPAPAVGETVPEALRRSETRYRRLFETARDGILLLHDIQPRTVAALPRILHELKVRG